MHWHVYPPIPLLIQRPEFKQLEEFLSFLFEFYIWIDLEEIIYGFFRQISCCWQVGPTNGIGQKQVNNGPFETHCPLLLHGLGVQANKHWNDLFNKFGLLSRKSYD